jgi:hypothetical protein
MKESNKPSHQIRNPLLLVTQTLYTRSGGVLTVIPTSLDSCKDRYTAQNVYGLRLPVLMAWACLLVTFTSPWH